MIPKKIDIGREINFPRFLETKALFTSSSGGGKSWAMRALQEAIAPTGVQQIILDPEGEFLTLREKFNFALVAETEGDIPLSVGLAETLALRILELNISVVIDLFSMKARKREEFIGSFLNAIVEAPKRLWHPCLIYVDEADKFAPEGEKKLSSDSMREACALGRKRGLCMILATQRLSKLSKSCTAELQNKFLGVTGQDIDRLRAADEIGIKDKNEIWALKRLEPGEFYASGPAIGYEPIKFKVGKVVTTHPQPGTRITVPPPTPNAIKKLLDKLKDIPKEAEQERNTKEQLQNEVARLSKELAQLKGSKGAVAPDPAKAAVISQLQGDKLRLENQVKSLQKETEALKAGFGRIHVIIKPFLGDSGASVLPPSPIAVLPSDRPGRRGNSGSQDDGDLAAGPRKMLQVLAMLSSEQVSRIRLSLLSGYSINSSTFGIYVNILKNRSLIVEREGGLQITPFGLDTVGDFEPLPIDRNSLISFWKGKLPKGPRTMFDVLASIYPEPIGRDQLAERSGFSPTSSTPGIYLNVLKNLKLAIESNKVVIMNAHIFQG